ncbi:MAG: AsmA-like C-terminal domain-containing protein [Alphaproteobacteria bacterium]
MSTDSKLKKTIKTAVRFASYVLIALFFLFSSVFLWISTGYRSVPFLASYITSTITEILPDNLALSIDDVELGLDRQIRLEFRLVNFKLLDENKGELGTENIVIKLDPLALFPQTHHNLLNVQVSKPTISYKEVQGNIASNSLPIQAINDYINKHKQQLLKFSLSFTDTAFAVDISDQKKANIIINDLIIKPDLKDGKIIFVIYGDITINNKNSVFEANIDTTSNKHLTVKGTISKLSNVSLEEFGIIIPELQKSNIDFDVGFKALLRGSRSVDYIEFDVNNVHGMINKNDFINQDTKIDKFSMHGYCNNNCQEIMVEKLKAKIGNIELFSTLEYKNILGANHIIAKFNTGAAKISDIENLWPKTAMSRTRDWVFEHISKGSIKSSKGYIDLNLKELEQKKLNNSKIELVLELEGTSISYIDTIKPVEDVSGTIKITPDLIAFDISKGKLDAVSLTKAQGEIRDLSSSKSYLSINAVANGNLQDMIDLSFKHAERDNTSLKGFIGTGSANIDLKMPIRDGDIGMEELDLSVTADAKDVSNKKIYREYGFTNGAFKINFKNFVAKVTGSALINGKTKAYVDLAQNILKDTRTVKVQSRFSWDDVAGMGIEKPEFINNHFMASIQLNESKGTEEIKLVLDLTDSTINHPRLNVRKKISEPAFLSMLVKPDKYKFIVDDYYIKLPTIYSKGHLVLDSDNTILKATSSFTKLGASQFSFSFEGGKNKNLSIKGDSFDASEVNFSPSLSNGTKSLNSETKTPGSTNSAPSNTSVSLYVRKLLLKDGVALSNAKAFLYINSDKLEQLRLTGTFDNNANLNINIKHPIFSIVSSDAGKFLRGFGATSKIVGGSINIHGKIADNKYLGKVEMEDYRAKKTSILMKIISIVSVVSTSLDGLSNLFDQEGMLFTKLSCPFTIDSNTIFLEKCKTKGPSLYITSEGTINLSNDVLDLKGSVAAQGLLNSTIRSIPLIGDILVGKKDQGLVGATYKVKGTLDDPDVSSNPLSIFAPGMLKEVFQ